MEFTKRLVVGREITWAEFDANLTEIEYMWSQMVALSGNALAATNFVGEWFTLTGPLSIPAATYSSGKFWMLLSNVADVTAHTPGVSAVWAELKQSDVVGPSSAVDGYGAVFDGATGKLLKSLGAAPVKKSGDTMTGPLAVPAGASGAQVPQAQEVVLLSGNQTIAGNKYFTGSVMVTGVAGLGYGVGSGGTVTQATSKATAVTLNKPSGRITMNNATLNASTSVSFVFNNSLLTVADGLVLNIAAGASANSYVVQTGQIDAGLAVVHLRNVSGSNLSEAVGINFQVIKGATS